MTAPTTAADSAPLLDPQNVQQAANNLVASSHLWLQSHWLQILIAAGTGAAIVALLHAARGLGARLAARSSTGKGWPAIFGRTILKTGNFFILMLAAKLVAGYAGAPSQVTSTIDFLFTVAAVFQAAIWAREIILGAIEHRTRDEEYATAGLGSAVGIIRVLVTFALFAIALVVVLGNVGVNVTGLIAGLGVGGIAIGLAAQGIFADLFAALAIILDRPFRLGDAISYDSTSGNVEEIGLKSTRIRGVDGEQRIISNRKLLDKEIINNSVRTHRRCHFAIGVIYSTPPDVCARIPPMLQEIVEANNRVFVRAGFTGFGDSSLDFDLQFDSDGADFAAFYAGRTTVGLAILKRFNDEGIEFAFPTQTTMTSAPNGTMIMPYAEVQPVRAVDVPPAKSNAE